MQRVKKTVLVKQVVRVRKHKAATARRPSRAVTHTPNTGVGPRMDCILKEYGMYTHTRVIIAFNNNNILWRHGDTQ